jgi:NitT/TauT family transport system ATP-binding protein
VRDFLIFGLTIEMAQPGFSPHQKPSGLRSLLDSHETNYNAPCLSILQKSVKSEQMEFSLQGISKYYPTRKGSVLALDQMFLQAEAHEFLCIVGPSGCGKTTLLKLIAGIQHPSAGSVQFAGPPPKNAPRCAMVFQDHGLFPWMNILDNVAFGLETQGVALPIRRQAAKHWLENIGLGTFTGHYPHELSGGMRQRAALGRAFLANAPILLMDEPFSALDAQMRLLLQAELLQCWAEKRQTVVYVTHDIDEAILLGDRVLVMSRRPGRILEEYRVPLSRPRTPQNATQQEVITLKWKIWQTIQAEVQPILH